MLPIAKENAVSNSVAEAPKDAGHVSDEALLFRVARADREALALLFRRHFQLVRWIGWTILRNSTEAEDLAQDVFLHIARKSHLYDSSKGKASGWIVRTAYFYALNRKEYLSCRHFYSAVEVEKIKAEAVPGQIWAEYDHSGEAVFGRARWFQIREVLTEDQWEAIRLHFFEGCTFAEIAERRNQKSGNVRHHFYRGMTRLRKYVFENER
jgi:RNA polymerase sigma-70 factor (ECF subfamily)